MLKDVAICEDVCGDWLGTPQNGYACQDIICLDCRMGDGVD